MVPFKNNSNNDEIGAIPIRELQLKCPVIEMKDSRATSDESADTFNELVKIVEVSKNVLHVHLPGVNAGIHFRGILKILFGFRSFTQASFSLSQKGETP